MSAAAVIVDSGTVFGISIDRGNFCTKRSKDLLGSNRGCAIGAVETNSIAG